MKTIVKRMDKNEVVALQRVAYDIITAQAMVKLYTDICKKYDAPELLDKYIAKYNKVLEQAIPHKQMLVIEIMNKYFPADEIKDRSKATYNVDYDAEEITYTYA